MSVEVGQQQQTIPGCATNMMQRWTNGATLESCLRNEHTVDLLARRIGAWLLLGATVAMPCQVLRQHITG